MFLARATELIALAGYAPTIVGSVATKGQSGKDLDIALAATTPHYDDSVLTRLGSGFEWADAGAMGETLVVHVPHALGFQVVEFFFEIPEPIMRQMIKLGLAVAA